MAGRTNKNEDPLRSLAKLRDEQDWQTYDQRMLFAHICTLQPNLKLERLEVVTVHDDESMRKPGMVYALVVDGKIFKIGHTITPFKKRVNSYNTGKGKYRSRGTNSGANYFILQSLLHFGCAVEVYGFYPAHKKWELLGETGFEAFPSSKTAEKIFLNRFRKSYGRLPIGCTQG